MLMLFCLNSIINGMLFFTFPPINNIISEYYNVDSALVDMSANISFIANAIVAIPIAFVISAWGTRPMLLAGAFLNLGASALRFFGKHAGGFYFILVGQFLVGLAFQCTFPVAARLAAIWFGENERATATSIGGLVNIVGTAFSFLMSTQIVRQNADKSVVGKEIEIVAIIFLALSGAAFILVIAFFREKPPTPSSNAPPDVGRVAGVREFFDSLKELMRNKQYLLLAMSFALYFSLYGAFSIVLNKMLTAKFTGYETKIGWMGFIHALAALPGTLLMGILLDKHRKYREQALVLNALSCVTLAGFAAALHFAGKNEGKYDEYLFYLLFFLFSAFGLYGTPFVTTGLAHAAVLTYGISEGTSGAVVMELGNIFTAIFVPFLGYFVNGGQVVIACIIMTGIYLVATLFAIGTKVEVRNRSHTGFFKSLTISVPGKR